MKTNKKDHHLWWNKHVKGKIRCTGNGGYCIDRNECYACGRCNDHCNCDDGPITPSEEWPTEDE